MQASNKAQLLINDRPGSFSIDEVDGKYILRLFITGNWRVPQHYQRFNAWLKNEYAIEGHIDTEQSPLLYKSLSFRSPDELFKLSIVMLGNRFLDATEPFKFLSLARLALGQFPLIVKNTIKEYSFTLRNILQGRYASELTRYYALIDMAVILDMDLPPLTLVLDNDGKGDEDFCKSMLTNIVQLLVGSSNLYRNIITSAALRVDVCNEMAYRATLAVKAMTKVAQLYPEEFLCVLNACINGNIRILQEMHLLIESDIVKYLDFFDLPSRPIINEGLTNAYANFKKQNYREFINKSKNYGASSELYDIVNIEKNYFQKLTLRVNQLTRAYNAAELILNNYAIVTSYLREIVCVISTLLPDQDQLLHPLFHKYNSCESPLIAAIHDEEIDQEKNLQLFKELSTAKKYNQRTPNIAVLSSGKKSILREVMAPLAHAVEYACPAVARILLEIKADIHTQDSRSSLLSRAMRRGTLEIVKLLIEFGADVMVVSERGKSTPLHDAQD
ncbi:MAG: ankyrin repeat domain-containing protein, partial [Pseudomonadota bacterium]|nr:ankyrin repeat domain-containing protein [Pseudomonadota bacterium]